MLHKPFVRLLFATAFLSSSFLSASFASAEKSAVPHLSGQLKVSIKQGTIDADISISNIPRSKDHSFQLNTGLNIKGITSEDGSVNFAYRRKSLEQFYESFAYTIPSDVPNELYQSKALNFRYSGKYPVYDQAFKARSDWKGNIAFNGKSLRVDGMQTALLPIYYDKQSDKLYKDVTYDLQIDCVDCTSLFVNGSTPIRASSHRFVSKLPAEPMMYMGDFDYIELGGNRVLNPLVKKDHIEQGLTVVAQYKSLLSKWFNQPLANGITFIQTTPVSEKTPGCGCQAAQLSPFHMTITPWIAYPVKRAMLVIRLTILLPMNWGMCCLIVIRACRESCLILSKKGWLNIYRGI